MKFASPIRRLLLAAAVAAALLALAVPAFARRTVVQKKQAARTQFEKAEQMREALNGRPAAQRSLREYQRAIDAYRRVYYTAPTSPKAHESVVAVAELLTDMGRKFDDEKAFQSAIGQYQFLRREYPGSRYRFDALFTIAQIYQDDLDNPAQAKEAFQEFLKQYPWNRLADDARKAIAAIDADLAAKKKGGKPARAAKPRQDAPREAQSKDAEARPVAAREPGRLPLVTGIRHWSTPDYTRVAIDLEDEVKYEAGRIPSPDRIYFDLHGTKLASELVGKTFEVEDGFLRKIRVAQYQIGMTRLVLDVDDISEYSAFLLPNPYRLIIDIHGKQPATVVAKADPAPGGNQPAKQTLPPTAATKTAAPPIDSDRGETAAQKADLASAQKPADSVKATSKPTTKPTFQTVAPREEKVVASRREPSAAKPPAPATKMSAAKPTAAGERSLIRALGLKIGRIVIDAGHGGHDTGTIGPRGLQEKDLALDVGLRLGKLLENRLGTEVVYTRDDDTFVPLETRTGIANKEEADLFLSIHANSSRDASARGIETYYLNFTSSADALEVAARENSVSESSIHELQDLVKKIALKDKIEESREFAGDVQQALHRGLAPKNTGLKDRGVKKAPFIVLIGANMPSVLAEISFVSNPTDEKKLMTPEYRQKVAESLYRGIAKYVGGLSGVKVASKLSKEKLAKGSDGE